MFLVIGLAANKADLFDKEQVTENEARQFATSINAIFRMTSAYTAGGIEELFNCIGKKFIDPNFDEENPNNSGKKKKVTKKKEEKGKRVKLDSNITNNHNQKGCCK